MSDAQSAIQSRSSEKVNANRGRNILEYMIRSTDGQGESLLSLIARLKDVELESSFYILISDILVGDFRGAHMVLYYIYPNLDSANIHKVRDSIDLALKNYNQTNGTKYNIIELWTIVGFFES